MDYHSVPAVRGSMLGWPGGLAGWVGRLGWPGWPAGRAGLGWPAGLAGWAGRLGWPAGLAGWARPEARHHLLRGDVLRLLVSIECHENTKHHLMLGHFWRPFGKS